MEFENSLFDRIISKNRPVRYLIGLILFFVLMLIGALVLDKALISSTSNIALRGLLTPPTIIIYILAIAPGMARKERHVLDSFYRITLLPKDDFQEIVRRESRIDRKNEIVMIGIGMIIGSIAAMGSTDRQFSWLMLYWMITSIAMYALLVWTIYVSILSTRLSSALLHQPMEVDPFNTKPFEPIGRQSLRMAIVFIGGITISLVLIGRDFSNFRNPLFWLIYIPLAILPIILFFLNMIPTHRVLSQAKTQELDSVRDHLNVSLRVLHQRLENKMDTDNIPAEISALAVYEKHLQETRTWPYNTAMLRTLFFSIMIPVGTLVGRIIVEILSG